MDDLRNILDLVDKLLDVDIRLTADQSMRLEFDILVSTIRQQRMKIAELEAELATFRADSGVNYG